MSHSRLFRSRSSNPGSAAAETSRCVCDKLYENMQLLIRFIDVPSLAPHLLGKRLIAEEEYKRLIQYWTDRRIQDSVVQMLLFVSHKPDWGRKLLRALEESIDQRHLGAVHLGHVVILNEFQQCNIHFTYGLEKWAARLRSLLESDVEFTAESTLGLLTTHLPLLIRYTDIDIVLPFLKAKQLLTDEEYMQLKKLWGNSLRRDAIETLLFTLSRKCEDWEECFVSALHQSLHSEFGDYHDGHKQILETLLQGGPQPAIYRTGCTCHCNCHQYSTSEAAAEDATLAKIRSNEKASREFHETASATIQQLYSDLKDCLSSLEKMQSVQVQRLKDISIHLDTLSTLCGQMMNKCQHKRIKQGIQKSLGQLQIGTAAFDTQVERQIKKYTATSTDRKCALGEQTFKPSWTDNKELKETLRYLNDYSTELLEWADTAFATIYPHDDMVLVRTR